MTDLTYCLFCLYNGQSPLHFLDTFFRVKSEHMTVDTLYQLFEKSIRLFMVGVGDKLEEEIRVHIIRRSHRRRYSFDDVF